MEKWELDNLWYRLRQGDKIFIAEVAGCSKVYVNLILRGKRDCKSDLAQRVIKIATQVAENNEALLAQKMEA